MKFVHGISAADVSWYDKTEKNDDKTNDETNNEPQTDPPP